MDSDGTVSSKIFGNIDPDESNLIPQYLTGPRSFASTEGSASLVFLNLRPDHIISSKNERRVYAKVVFTAFRGLKFKNQFFISDLHILAYLLIFNLFSDTCSYRSISPPSKNATIIRKQEMVYRSCTTSSASGKNCIAAELFCDGNFNCAETEDGTFGLDETYVNCDSERKSRTSRIFSNTQGPSRDPDKNERHNSGEIQKKPVGEGDLMKTLIVDQEYDEYFTDLFKSVVIGFLGLCTTCILVAFVVTMFCFGRNQHETSF